jgi:tripartite-type tricarboxylate transporter receptor subunit TctC
MALRLMHGAILLGSLLLAAHAAPAENWPGTRPVKFEVTAGAGGLIDFVPRELSDPLSAALGVPVVVENRPGAGGNIAAGIVAKAEPDGHTLLVTGSNQAVNPTLLPDPGFDYKRDLVPVSMVVRAKMMLVASPAFSAKNITDLIAMAKQKPNSVSIAISPIGTPNHLGAEMLTQYGHADLIFVPYDTIAKSMVDLMANRVDLAVGAVSSVMPLVRVGKLKAVAVLAPQRSPLAPEIPTSAEAGLAAMQIDGWICIMVTGGTPAPVIARLDREIVNALAVPQVQAAFAKQGIEDYHMDPQQLGTFLDAEAARYSDLLKHSRVKATSH